MPGAAPILISPCTKNKKLQIQIKDLIFKYDIDNGLTKVLLPSEQISLSCTSRFSGSIRIIELRKGT
jgi:hypothetical protein